ncbi:hypothetical protein [Streptomyces kanamyceticus]|uniref:Uncharacterized protein n=2 Tax=Streptomyces kanamyceticus TaxID=1967 RepID=A0A5J6GKU9_STRKN|nr:hypothetical protein [Streptomyces kanamyceticus]QEU95072.1 hypothetical protein CP970_32945 [Streptomyces kanamyceticus]
MVVFTPYAIGTSDDPRGMPAWLDTLLATLTFTLLFGVLPAWMRLRARRRSRHTRDKPAAVDPQRPRSPAPVRDLPRPTPTSRALTHARQTLPHPVARAIRALQQADTPRDQYEAMLDAAESLALTVCVTAAALLHRPGADSGAGVLSVLRSACLGAGTTFGTWTVGLDRVLAVDVGHPRLPSGLRSGVADMVDDLKALKAERNRTAHGDKPLSRPESALRVAECRGFLEHALAAAQFLEELPWLCVASCDYRQRTRNFLIVARNATGDHPVFERQTYEWDQPVARDAFYLLAREERVPLSPFVTYTFCPQCRDTETCYTSRVPKGGSDATVKSFSRGHEIPVPDLGDEIRALPGRR